MVWYAADLHSALEGWWSLSLLKYVRCVSIKDVCVCVVSVCA